MLFVDGLPNLATLTIKIFNRFIKKTNKQKQKQKQKQTNKQNKTH